MDQYYLNYEILVRYLNGECTPEEERKVRQWINAHPENEKMFIHLNKIWESPVEEKYKWDSDAGWSRFKREYDLFKETSLKKKESSKKNERETVIHSIGKFKHQNRQQKAGRKRYLYYAIAVAAAVILMVTVTLQSVDTGFEGEHSSQPELREFVTENGQRTRITLSDGSNIILNAASRLVVPETFNDPAQREIHLSGEAYFEVSHDPDRSFTVYTENAVTHVLGTKFNVKSYGVENEVRVVVTEGKVALQSRTIQISSGTTIGRNQMGILSENGHFSVEDISDPAVYLGWIEGKLVFNDEPLSHVIQRLERWFDIRIVIDPADPELAAKKLTAEFAEEQPLEEVLEAVSISLDLSYSRASDESGSFTIFKFYNQQSIYQGDNNDA